MNPKDAAMAVRDMIKPESALPIDCGTRPLLRGTPAEFRSALGTARVLLAEPGRKLDF